MFIPLTDANPLRHLRFPYVNYTLVALNIAIFLFLQSGMFLPEDNAIPLVFGVTPAVLAGSAVLDPQLAVVPESVTLLTYMFLHGGWMHLGSNMLFLWTFGDNIEDAMGRARYLLFYLLCGVAGGLVHAAMFPNSDAPLIGASGAVAGIVAAYLLLHPRIRIWVLFLGRIPLRITAAWALGGWVVLQFVNALFLHDDNVAWWAHIGGILAGAVLIVVLRRPGVPLFDRGLAQPGEGAAR